MNKTDKSSLMRKLEAKGTNDGEPARVYVYLIDAIIWWYCQDYSPGNMFLWPLFVHIICDTYGEGPSIQEHERDSGGKHHTAYKLTEPSQQRPADFHQTLNISLMLLCWRDTHFTSRWSNITTSTLLNIEMFIKLQQMNLRDASGGRHQADFPPSLSLNTVMALLK